MDDELTLFISGGDDFTQKDDNGERRRKHELSVLASAGIKSEDDVGSEDDAGGSDDDFYSQVEQARAAKLATKAEIYKRIPSSHHCLNLWRESAITIDRLRRTEVLSVHTTSLPKIQGRITGRST